MQTRRDQVQAYRFAQARLQAAVLGADPDRAESPLRRSGVATFAGVMVATLVVAGFGVLGLVRPSSKVGWDAPGVLVVEKETGTRFVYDPVDGALHPVLNYASARLALDRPAVRVEQFSRASLAGVRRGAPRGIPGAPDALPAADGLVAGPWSVCSGVTDGAAGRPSLSVSVGSAPSGTRVSGDKAVVVRSEDDGRTYLVWQDSRLLIPDSKAVLAVFGGDAWQVLTVSSRWLNAIAPGHDLVPPLPSGIGSALPYRVGSRTVYLGQVLRMQVEGGVGTRYYVALADGVAGVSDVVALLLLVDPQTRFAYGGGNPVAFEVQPADIAKAPQAATPLPDDGLPSTIPQDAMAAESADGAPPAHVCGVFADPTGKDPAARVWLADRVPGAASGVPAPAAGAPSDAAVPKGMDVPVEVIVPPGRAAIVHPLVHAGQASSATFLVTDLGAAFPVPTDGARAALGYGGADVVPVPKGILDLVPVGPVLDPSRANVDRAVAVPPAG